VSRLVLLLFIFLTSCVNLIEEEIRAEEYGDYYADMDCWWSKNEGPNTFVFNCHDNLETDLISGQVAFALIRDDDEEYYFTICGRNIVLNSGYTLHDTLIAFLTADKYACHEHYENQLGNEFDTIWDAQRRALQVIWRPVDDVHKALTLYLPLPEGDSVRVLATLYYKTI
tara:strand:- start:324 stop:833 length:510 start_codon:yes stop_codon:yes gene_type:complete